ncbi:MAG: SPOR domain-containing protein [Candidatus Endonucleobacter sp. (ex Gigantidas childressi)]|nr:SPOR domain-containing protein [Candidatus Endonucleobacter sp. (ex Gigantidas childressi)]
MRSQSAVKRGASKARKRSDNKSYLSSIPGWLWLLTGLAGGFFVALLFELSPATVDTEEVAESSELIEQTSGPKPVFDFYKLLPESEMNLSGASTNHSVLEHTAKPDKEKGQKGSASKNEAPSRYLLQAGSFRSIKDANHLKVQLLLWELSPNIEKITVGNGESWYRVQLGPFDDTEELHRTQRLLAKHNIDSLMLKMR